MNKVIILLFILLIPAIVFAVDPKINDVTYEQPMVNQQTTFTVHFTPDGKSGVIRFVDNGYLITQRAFDYTMNTIDFTYTWNVRETRTIKFYFVDMNIGDDTDLLNNEWQRNIDIKTGVDFIIDTIQISPTQFTPDQNMKALVTIKNIGDENYSGTVPVDILVDGNFECQINIDTNITMDGNCSWIAKDTNKNTASINAIVNRTHTIPEFSYTNNSKTLDLLNIAKPDLIINKIQVSNQLRRGVLENIQIYIKNQGGARAENISVNVYLTHLGSKYRVYSQIIPEIFVGNSQGINVVYSFNDIGDYIITAVLDADNTINEAIENNNEFSLKITVVDFNFSDIIKENDVLRTQLATEQGKTTACLTENSMYKEDIIQGETKYKGCLNNLEICNTNNSTKISNWMKEYDANNTKTYELQYTNLLNEKKNLEQQCTVNTAALTDEKNQWSGLVIGALLLFVLWLGYEEWSKRNPRKGVNMHG